jgi:hypothetical protein
MEIVARTKAIICGVNFQSATPFGSRFDVEAPRKLRLPDIMKLLEDQCGISPAGVFPLGFGSPLCNAFARISYRDGRWQHTIPDLTLDDYVELLGEDPVDFVRSLAIGFDEAGPKLLKLPQRDPARPDELLRGQLPGPRDHPDRRRRVRGRPA